MNAPVQSLSPALQRSAGDGRLAVKHVLGRTRTDRLFQEGAAKIRVPDRADGLYEAVLINTAGGLTGGDRMSWRFDIAAGANVTLTTQACEKIYASSGGTAAVSTRISLAAGARAAWLPQETILFDGAALARRLDIDMDSEAEVLVVEPMAFGRLAMGEKRISGMFTDRWRILRGGSLAHAEDFRIGPHISETGGNAAVLGGAGCFATALLVSPRAEALTEPAREIIGRSGGASFWNGKLLARLYDEDAYALRKRLVPLVQLLNQGAALPKCWSL
jgi:urease accessory protein